ncbi:MAG TPA: hypothetical protein VF832_06175, partial [Longimicrobiales bacterium]
TSPEQAASERAFAEAGRYTPEGPRPTGSYGGFVQAGPTPGAAPGAASPGTALRRGPKLLGRPVQAAPPDSQR